LFANRLQCTFHITWQCHNKSWLLQDDWAKSLYYNLLLKYKNRYKISIYSYCFMDNHPHLTGFCKKQELLSDFFRLVNSLFARTYNKKVQRKGQVVMDRFKSPLIQTDADLLKVMSYIDLNPIRARMVKHPNQYPWSSYAYYALGEDDPLITPAPSYLMLGLNPKGRQQQYREMVEKILEADWASKRPYSSIAFIGNPDWIAIRTAHQRKAQRVTEAMERKAFGQVCQ
jgi:putative transposase